MTIKVIELLFLRVPQDFIRFSGLFEFLFGFPITWIPVGMVLEGQFSVGLFDFILGCVS